MTGHSGTRQRGRWINQRRSAALACVVGVAAQACLGVNPALATLSGPGVGAGRNITVFHNLDFVGVFGYGPVGELITVDVIRGGVRIGTTTGPSVETAEGPGLEVNHGPVGTAEPGDCWTRTTPDIRPGDRIVVTSGGVQDEVTVDNIRYTGQPSLDPGTGDVTVAGIAHRADGTPIPASFLDSGEFRDPSGNYRSTPDAVEPTTGVNGGFTMRYRPPYTGFRNRSGLSEDQRRQALLGEGHAIGFGHTAPLPAESMLVDGIADVPGPALGCEAAPAANDTTPVSPPPIADTTAPRVTSPTPTLGATQVNPNGDVTVGFDEPVTGINTATFTLTGPSGPVAGAITYDNSLHVATFNPSMQLAAGTTYTAALTSAVTDIAGNHLTATSWTFTTVRDTVAPTVTQRNPASGAKRVNLTANLTATFSEPVTGISATSMTLKTDRGVASTATVTYNPTTRVATLDPTATLAKRTRYTAALTNTITDTAGNRLSAQSWTFTTGG